MKKGVSGPGVVFGRVVVVDEGDRDVQKCAGIFIGAQTRGKAQCLTDGELFRCRVLVELKISKL